MHIRLRATTLVSVAFMIMLALVAFAAPLVAPHNPLNQHLLHRLAPPSSSHLLGTDQYGRDILSRVIWGARVSLEIGTMAVLIGAVGGVTLGLVTGYFGGLLDLVIGRVIDALLTIPTILLALALIAGLGSGIINVMMAVGISMVPGMARLVRGGALSVRHTDYVEAARASGARHARIIVRHVLPNVMSLVIVYTTFGLANAILSEASLSFLGVGVSPPTPDWGRMVANGGSYLGTMPWLSMSPAIAIMLTVMASNIAGDALRDALDPRPRQTISSTGL